MSSLLERQPLLLSDNLLTDMSPRAHSTLLELKLNAQSQQSSRMKLAKMKDRNSRLTSATGSSLPNITSKQGALPKVPSNALFDSALSSMTAVQPQPSPWQKKYASATRDTETLTTMPSRIVVDPYTPSAKASHSRPNLRDVKNQIIQQIGEHRERLFHKDRHAVKDISLLAKI